MAQARRTNVPDAQEGTIRNELSKGMQINITERDADRLCRAARSARLYGRGLKIPLLLFLAQYVDDERDADGQQHGQKREQKAADQTPAPTAAAATRRGGVRWFL